MSSERDTQDELSEENMSETKLNKRAAEELAEKKDFDKDQIRVCVSCGRTVAVRDGGKVFCTCEPFGPPMTGITED